MAAVKNPFDQVRETLEEGSRKDIRRLLTSPLIGELSVDDFVWLVIRLPFPSYLALLIENTAVTDAQRQGWIRFVLDVARGRYRDNPDPRLATWGDYSLEEIAWMSVSELQNAGMPLPDRELAELLGLRIRGDLEKGRSRDRFIAGLALMVKYHLAKDDLCVLVDYVAKLSNIFDLYLELVSVADDVLFGRMVDHLIDEASVEDALDFLKKAPPEFRCGLASQALRLPAHDDREVRIEAQRVLFAAEVTPSSFSVSPPQPDSSARRL